MEVVMWVVVGLIVGWLAGLIMKGSGYGLVGDIALGLVGAVVGGWLFGLAAPAAEPSGLLGSIVVATIGAIALIVVARLLSGRPVRA